MSTKELYIGLAIGIGVGIGVGILMAPVSGAELRNNIADKANDLADVARGKVGSVRKKVAGSFRSSMNEVAEAIAR